MKTAVITGAAGGMGFACAKQLLKEGYKVFGLDKKEPGILDGLHFVQTNLTDTSSVEQAFKKISAEDDGIDCLINMAGIYDLDSLVEISEEDFLKIFNVNLFAAYRVNKTFLPLFKKGARVILTSSELAPLDPLPFTGIYAVTKAALDKYAYSLRMELQLLGYKVIVLRPGAVKTDMLNDSITALSSFCSGTELYTCSSEKFRQIVGRIEARNVPPERIAEVVSEALSTEHPKLVYTINRNPLLLLMNRLPDSLQLLIIRWLLHQDR